MAQITPITVKVESFVSGPATELKKLNKFADAIRENQQATKDLTKAAAANDISTLSQVIVSGNLNGGVPGYATLAAFVAPTPL